MHRCIAILGPAIRVSYRDPSIAILKKKKNFFFFFFLKSHMAFSCFALFVAHTQRGLCCASFIVPFKGTFG